MTCIPAAGQVLTRSLCLEGRGLHGGQAVRLEIHPAPVGHGAVFSRVDLPGGPQVRAHISSVRVERQCTGLRQGDVEILTVEHLLAALAGLGLWDVKLKLDGPEVPILDGSAAPFVSALVEAGLTPSRHSRPLLRVKRKIRVEREDRWISLEPFDGFEVDCLLDFDHPLLHQQRYEYVLGRDSFVRELAPARTFGFLKDVDRLHRAGLAKGGGLDNAVVIDDFSVLNEEGLRFPNEFARNKVLDILGDLALLGMPLVARVRANKSGHGLHHELLRVLLDDASIYTLEDSPLEDAGLGLASVIPAEPQQA